MLDNKSNGQNPDLARQIAAERIAQINAGGGRPMSSLERDLKLQQFKTTDDIAKQILVVELRTGRVSTVK